MIQEQLDDVVVCSYLQDDNDGYSATYHVRKFESLIHPNISREIRDGSLNISVGYKATEKDLMPLIAVKYDSQKGKYVFDSVVPRPIFDEVESVTGIHMTPISAKTAPGIELDQDDIASGLAKYAKDPDHVYENGRLVNATKFSITLSEPTLDLSDLEDSQELNQ